MKNPLIYVALLLACLLMAGWSRLDQNSKAPKWEYKLVSAVLNQVPIQWYEDGKRVDGQVKIFEKSNQLGAQGWELVSFQNASDTIVYWFKRAQ